MRSVTRNRLVVASTRPGRQLDWRHAGLRLRKIGRPLARHAQHAHRRHVAFEQRVGRLRRAVGEEDHAFGCDARVREHLAEHLDNALGDAAGMRVRGEHRVPADHFARGIVDQHGLGERAADIDADAIAARLARPARHRSAAVRPGWGFGSGCEPWMPRAAGRALCMRRACERVVYSAGWRLVVALRM